VSACLHNDIDDYLAAAALADMGAAGNYTDLLVQHIEVGYLNPEPSESWEFPAVIINGISSESESGPHGDGLVHLETTYPYVLAAITHGTDYAVVKQDANELRRRLVAIVTSRYALGGLAATDGETVQRSEVKAANVYVYPVRGRGDAWWGVATVDVDIFATT
jgi:hypothetical protein